MLEHSLHVLRKNSANESIYIKTNTQVVGHSSVIGSITKKQFIQAIQCLEKKYPILLAVADSEKLSPRTTDYTEIIAWSVKAEREDIYEKLLNIKLNVTESLYSVSVLNHSNSFDIFTVTSHAITDATSVIDLHKDLVYFCDFMIQHICPMTSVKPIAESIDFAVNNSISMLKNNIPLAEQYQGTFLQLPTTLPNEFEYCQEQLVIPSIELHNIMNLCKKNGVSFHGVLVASFALAIRELSPDHATQILMRSSIDLRRRVTPHINNEIIFTAATGHITRIFDLTGNILKIGEFVMNEIRNSTENGTIFQDHKEYFKRFISSENIPIALNISDMGVVKLQEYVHLKHVAFDYALGWKKSAPNVSITINDNGLVANIVYIKQGIKHHMIHQLAKLARHYLVSVVN